MSDVQTSFRVAPAKTHQTRRSIVDAALTIFLERGFSDTRMIDVANRAGVAKGTLYLYFTDKVALFEGVLQEVIAAPISHVSGLEPGADESVRSFLMRVVAPIMRDLERSRRASVMRLVVSEGARFPALADAYRRLAVDPLVDFLQSLAVRARDRGEISSDALLRFPLLMMAPGLVATVWNGLYGTTRPLATGSMFEAYVDLVFGPG